MLLPFDHSVMSDSLWPHGLQHSRLPCPSEFAQTHVHWIGDAIQPSHPLLSPSLALGLSQHQGSFPMSRLFALGGQSIEASASASVLPNDIQGWFPSGLIGLISLQSKGLSRVFSNTIVWKDLFFGAQPSLWSNEVKARLKQVWEGWGYKWRKLAEKVFIIIFFFKQKREMHDSTCEI